ncbi:MAG: UDP binding domain-containing protein, partial [Psychroflexus salarius]
DIREAPALYMIEKLLEAGAKIKAFDPEAMENVKQKLGDKIQFVEDMYNATQDTDALLICTEWSIFRTPNFSKLKEQMNDAVIFDGRNLYDIDEMTKAGFKYTSIGRTAV